MDVSMAMRDCINVRNFRADALAVLRKGGEAA